MPLDDSDLHDPRLTDIQVACKSVLQEKKWEDIYEHNTGSCDRASVKRFFEALARLPPEDQLKCFDSIVAFLKGEGLGLQHVADRLLNGKRNCLSEYKLRCEI